MQNNNTAKSVCKKPLIGFKKFLAICLAVVLTAAASPAVFADYEYTNYHGPHSFSNGVCTHCNLTGGYLGNALAWVLDEESGTLTISGTGDMYHYSNRSPWYSKRNSITAVIIEDGVTSIMNSAFYACTRLKSVTIPDGVTKIGWRAFEKCINLTSVDIPGSVEYLESSLFEDCFRLETVNIPSGVTSIEYATFSGCSSLTSVTVPNSVTSIGEHAFWDCKSLTSVTIPDGVTSIGGSAFNDCISLTSINIPDSVTSIGNGAFFGCISLTSITIPDSVTRIENSVFAECIGLTSFTIPDGVTSIGNSAFSGCSGLTSINIPDSVTSIGDGAFNNCSSLTSITIPAGVTSIENGVFYSCSGLTSINIPDSVTSIGDGAFNNCSSLTSITIPAGVTSIGEWSFSNCYNLTSVIIPAGVTDIGNWAFSYCHHLTSVIIHDGVTSIGERAFFQCNGLTSVAIPNSVTSIGDLAFDGCYFLTLTVNPGSCAHSYAVNNNIPYILDGKIVSTEITLKKEVYPIDGKIRKSNLVVIATFEGGATADITKRCSFECDMTTAGVKTATVTYKDYTATFKITVDADLVEYPESDHPYADNEDDTWYYTHKEPADSLNITFSFDTETEYDCDYIFIYDGNGNQIGMYTGMELAGKTIRIPGNSFSISLTSDSSYNTYGFSIIDITAALGDGCEHKNTELLDYYTANYTTDGFSGDLCCADCGMLIERGNRIYAFCDFDKNGFVNPDDYYIFEEMDKQAIDLSLFDFDGDGEITDFDLTIVRLFTIKHVEFNEMADANYDYTSDIRDLVRIKKLIVGTSTEGDDDLNLDGNGDAEDVAFVRKFILVIPPEWREINIK